MDMLRRMLYTPIFHIDTNLINARGKLDAMNQIEKWASDDVILVNMSNVSFYEAQQGNSVERTKKALSHIFTLQVDGFAEVDPLFIKFREAVFPGQELSQNQINDIKVLCEASKWNAYLITNDGGSKKQPGGILGNRDKISDYVTVMRDVEVVTFINEKIKERDAHNLKVHQYTGLELPDWHGNDEAEIQNE